MSNSLLESLWARVDANIGARITQISDLLTQALSANTESIAALAGKASAQALTDGLATRVEGGTAVKKIEVVTTMPSTPVATTLYLVVG